MPLNPRQRRTSDAAPIAHLGAADSLDRFRLKLLGRTPFGRGRVKLEWEVKPLGASFSGSGTAIGAPSDTGILGVQLNELTSGLLAATSYHWRVRLRYDSATTPFAQYSRWLTMPWKGWQETMLHTKALAGGRVLGLLIGKAAVGDITLNWNASCLATDTDYAIYEGVLGSYTSHDFRYCSTGGATTKAFTPAAGDAYYLVVPRNAAREGSYGTDSSGVEKPQGVHVCLPQQIGACP